ncbi:MAG: sigma-70 family RNA polymerase sigma factor [Bacteroidales bacterium]|nr:sigma-70 family RNA polymerase sigma factor [Candidatus Cacconaster caballi]
MAKTGEKRIEEMFGQYRQALIAYILKFVSVREDAEDICQRTYEKAFLNIDRYNSRYAFSTWLFNIAKNEAIDHLRHRSSSIVAVPINQAEDTREACGSSPEEQMIVSQAVKSMLENIRNLPPTYCKVAELRFIKDLAYEDIASVTGLTLATVKTRINRARKMLLASSELNEDGKDI